MSSDIEEQDARAVPRKRADAQRNEQSLVAAAAIVFVKSGVEAPVRDIAAAAGVGAGTIYRHFPTRADLIVAVYRHQVEACAEAGPALLVSSSTPHAALATWINLFADFLVTKHGLAAVLRHDSAGSATCTPTSSTGSCPCVPIAGCRFRRRRDRLGHQAYELMRGVGNLCIGADSDADYDARRPVGLLITGLRRPR